MLILWNSSIFTGVVLEKKQFALTISFTSVQNQEVWKLSLVYGPCSEPDRSLFIEWLKNLQIGDADNWLVVGDFNFYRSLEDWNRPGGNLQDTLLFNDAIGQAGLIELPLKGRAFTWSNMQQDPLLEQLDWFFTSVNWTTQYPNTMVHPMSKPISDHIPCKIMIGTSIPKSTMFRFENFWPDHPGFLETVQASWSSHGQLRGNSASTLA